MTNIQPNRLTFPAIVHTRSDFMRADSVGGIKKALDFHGTLAQYAMLMMEMNNGEAQNMIQEMQRRQTQGQEARDAANQIEELINELGTSDKKIAVGEGIRKTFDKYDIEITTDANGTKQTLQQWEGRDKKVGEEGYLSLAKRKSAPSGIVTPSGAYGFAFAAALKAQAQPTYTAAQLRSLKAAAEGFTEQASDSRTVDQIKINKKLQEYNGASTLVNTIYSSQGSQLNQINGSMRT